MRTLAERRASTASCSCTRASVKVSPRSIKAPRALPEALNQAPLAIDTIAALNPIANLADGTVEVVTPAAAAGGAGAFGIAGLFSGLFKKTLSAREAYSYLAKEPRTILVDIRSKAEVGETGSPSLKEARKGVVSLPFTKVVGEEEVLVEGFADRFKSLSAIKDDAVVLLLDSDGSLAGKAASSLSSAQAPQEVILIRGGASGSKGWLASELPWKEPFSLPSLPMPESLDALAESFKKNPSLANTALALGALVSSVTFIVNEFDLLLELAGVVGVGQLVYKNLLFADDRESTLKKLQAFVQNTGADAAGEDLKKLAQTVLDKADKAATAAADKAAATAAAKEAAAATVAAAAPAPTSTTAADSVTTAGQVDEARAWIAAWRAKQGSGSQEAAAGAVVPDNVAEARAWIAKWRAQTRTQAAAAAVAAASAQVQSAIYGEVAPVEKEVVGVSA